MASRWEQHYDPVDVVLRPYDAYGVTINQSGDTPLYDPGEGSSFFLQYVCLSADGANSGDVTVVVKWEGGQPLYKLSLKPGAIWARNIGAGKRALRGAVNQRLILNLDAAQAVHVSFEGEDA